MQIAPQIDLSATQIIDTKTQISDHGPSILRAVILSTQEMIHRAKQFGAYTSMDGSHGMTACGWTTTFFTTMNSANKVRIFAVLLGCGDNNENQKWALRVLKERLPWHAIDVVHTDQRTDAATVTDIHPGAHHLFAGWHFEHSIKANLGPHNRHLADMLTFVVYHGNRERSLEMIAEIHKHLRDRNCSHHVQKTVSEWLSSRTLKKWAGFERAHVYTAGRDESPSEIENSKVKSYNFEASSLVGVMGHVLTVDAADLAEDKEAALAEQLCTLAINDYKNADADVLKQARVFVSDYSCDQFRINLSKSKTQYVASVTPNGDALVTFTNESRKKRTKGGEAHGDTYTCINGVCPGCNRHTTQYGITCAVTLCARRALGLPLFREEDFHISRRRGLLVANLFEDDREEGQLIVSA